MPSTKPSKERSKTAAFVIRHPKHCQFVRLQQVIRLSLRKQILP